MIVLRGKVEPGAAFPAHSHDREEVLIFLAGSGRAKLGGEEERVVAGDVAIVPANTVHEFAAAGGEALQAIGILPAGARMFLAGRRGDSVGLMAGTMGTCDGAGVRSTLFSRVPLRVNRYGRPLV